MQVTGFDFQSFHMVVVPPKISATLCSIEVDLGVTSKTRSCMALLPASSLSPHQQHLRIGQVTILPLKSPRQSVQPAWREDRVASRQTGRNAPGSRTDALPGDQPLAVAPVAITMLLSSKLAPQSGIIKAIASSRSTSVTLAE